MIHVRMYGGLGNQLFQLAAALRIRQQTNSKSDILINYTGNKYVEKRFLSIDSLLHRPSWITQIPACRLDRLLRLVSDQCRFGKYGWNVSNDCYTFLPFPTNTIFIDGYFFNNWDKAQANLAFKDISLKEPVIEAASAALINDSVVVHIRGGDFIHLSDFNVCRFEYYLDAFAYARDQGLTRFAIVTDDPIYSQILSSHIKAYMPYLDIVLLPQSSAINDFDLLRTSQYKILSNSTFAWWASVFSTHTKLTVVPSHFTSRLIRSTLDHEIVL